METTEGSETKRANGTPHRMLPPFPRYQGNGEAEAHIWVTVAGGLVVPGGALELLQSLERRGARLSFTNDELTIDGSVLTDADRATIQQWKSYIIELAAREEPNCG
jgi:hypothetical protein